MNQRPPTRLITPAHRAGFTIIETVLASVVGALVLMGCVSVFLATNRAERAFSQRFERTSELWTTQLAMRRSFMQLLMEEQPQTAQATRAAAEQPAAYPRVLLTTDTAAPADEYGWTPQRLEMTLGRSPVPAILGSSYGSWLVESDRADSLDFSSANLSSGAIRGVFELRPAGTRELLMSRAGLTDADPALERRMAQGPLPGWTLWWRPILSTELAALEAGTPPSPDNVGTEGQIRMRLAGAIPLLTGIRSLNWLVFKNDEHLEAYQAGGIVDLPAFAQLEVFLLNGQYANWMFEVGWTMGADPVSNSGSGADVDDPDNPGNPAGPGGPGGPGGPAGPGAPGAPGGGRPLPGKDDAHMIPGGSR